MKIETIKNIVADKGSEKLKGFKLVDFLTDINKKKSSDVRILRHWKDYFNFLKVPYVVQETDKHFKLWKKDEVCQ